jgi:hypothetical protein
MAGASTEVEIPKSKCEIFPQAGKRESQRVRSEIFALIPFGLRDEIPVPGEI